MSPTPLSKVQIAVFRQAYRDVAQRAAALLQEQVVAQRIDVEAAEDYVVWADERLADADSRNSFEIINQEHHWWRILVLAESGRRFVREQIEAANCAKDHRNRQIEFIRMTARRMQRRLTQAEQQILEHDENVR